MSPFSSDAGGIKRESSGRNLLSGGAETGRGGSARGMEAVRLATGARQRTDGFGSARCPYGVALLRRRTLVHRIGGTGLARGGKQSRRRGK